MVTTRSMSGTTSQRAEVTNAMSEASEAADVEASKKLEKSNDRYFDIDERTLALGIYLGSWKGERQKEDPDFTFTPGSYKAAKQEFDSLTDSVKAPYVAEAQRRNSVEVNAMPIEGKRKATRPKKLEKIRFLMMDANAIFTTAQTQQYLKDDPNFTYASPESFYDGPLKAFGFLSDEDKAPYIAVAMERILAKHATYVSSAWSSIEE